MLFSPENKSYKVLFTFALFLTLISTISTVDIKSLLDLPLKVPTKSSTIHATLTDVYASKKYFLNENISVFAVGKVKGKIVISGEHDPYTIHYATSYSGKDSKQRLVIKDTKCSLYTFKKTWDQNLPGIDRPLLNSLFLMGPSVSYRISESSFVWKPVPEKVIRGVTMMGATTQINNLLQITYYYKNNLDEESGIKNPSRIEFIGYDTTGTSKIKENFILDIYRKDENTIDPFQNEIQPQPGIGCPNYLNDYKSTPSLHPVYVRYIIHETIQGSSNIRTTSEIYAAQRFNTLKMKTTLLGVTSEVVYDYNLGVSFIFTQGGSCNILLLDSYIPGIDEYGQFRLTNLFLLDSSFQYNGKHYMDNRPGFPVEVWESVRYKFNINGKTYDKAVVTQYFAESEESIIFHRYTLIRTMITTYKYDSLKKEYIFVDRITRDYMNMENTETNAQFFDSFRLKSCKFSTNDKTLTLNFKLTCDDGTISACNELVEENVYVLRREFFNWLLAYNLISPMLIDGVEYRFPGGNQIEMEVNFLGSPDLQYIFKPKTMSVSDDTFKRIIKLRAKSPYECLEKAAASSPNVQSVIYRSSDSICGYLTKISDLKKDIKLGQSCDVFLIPLSNLQRIKNILSLNQIHDKYKQFIGKRVHLWNGMHSVGYEITDVIDKTQTESNDGATYVDQIGSKLKDNNQFTVIATDAKTYTDCRKECKEKFSCNIFSFCKSDTLTECRVSSLTDFVIPNSSHVEKDEKCTIYGVNVIEDYMEIPKRKFKTQISTSIQTSSSRCAALCKFSSQCVSFQHCDGYCNFNGVYTDKDTEYDVSCSVYFPKVSEKYRKTGDKIVSQVAYTEMNLNLDQCASLCHGWSDGETKCKSFNYCPKSKTQSSCSLTQFSVKSSGVETIDGGDCSNYELKDESKGKSTKELNPIEVINGITGSAAFGIILLFLFVGSILGIFVPFVITKVKNLKLSSNSNESFSWKRQVDEQREI